MSRCKIIYFSFFFLDCPNFNMMRGRKVNMNGKGTCK